MLGRLSLFFIMLVLVGVFFTWIEQIFSRGSGPVDFTGSGASITEVKFSSDGVLTKKWFMNWFGPLRGRSLMEVDINKLRMDLENENQVVVAQIRRNFPATLEISLHEQTPIMVLRLKGEVGRI